MKYFIYDTETTGLTGKDEVIQFSGFLTDNNLKKLEIVNFYAYTEKPIHRDAQGVHGINKKALWYLSNNKTFEEQIYDYDFIFEEKDLIFIGYNVGFDNRLVNQTLKNNGFNTINFGNKLNTISGIKTGRHYYDLMIPLSHYLNNGVKMRLSNAVSKIKSRSMSELNVIYDYVFKNFGVSEYAGISKFHNALYDSFMCWVLLNEFGMKLNTLFRV